MSSVAQICALTNHAERNHRRQHRKTTADSIFTFLSPAKSATSPADAAGKLLLPETTDVVFFAPSHSILPLLSFSLNSSSLFTNNKLIKHRHCHYWHTKHLLLLLTLASNSKIEHSRWTKKVWMHIHSFILFLCNKLSVCMIFGGSGISSKRVLIITCVHNVNYGAQASSQTAGQLAIDFCLLFFFVWLFPFFPTADLADHCQFVCLQ